MVNVFKSNFIEQSNELLRHLPHASLISIDEEMTGIVLPPAGGNSTKPSKEDSPANRYPSLKKVPERYSIIQLGICLFTKKADHGSSPHAASSAPRAPVRGENDNDDNDDEGDVRDADQREGNEAADDAHAREGRIPLSSPYDRAHYHVRRFNFTMFPPTDNWITREVTMNPSSMHFLQQHGLNLDSWAAKGIPFVTTEMAKDIIQKYFEKESKILKEQRDERTGKASSSSSKGTPRRSITLTAQDDKTFHARAMAGLREWIDAAIVPREEDPEGASYCMPPCNSFLRRALYESIDREYPDLVLETVSNQNQIRVWRLSKLEKQLRQERLRREGWEKLFVETVGMWRVFAALSMACRGEFDGLRTLASGPLTDQAKSLEEHVALSFNAAQALKYPSTPSHSFAIASSPVKSIHPAGRKIPLIVHNGLQDLMFLMTHFHSRTLPENWADCKRLIHHHFPVIYDTKTLSVEHQKRQPNARHHTHLSAVYERAITNQAQWQDAFTLQNPTYDGFLASPSSSNHGEQRRLQHQRQQQQQATDRQEHEASYDAYMTGAAFCALTYTLQEQYNYPPLTSVGSYQSPQQVRREADDVAGGAGRTGSSVGGRRVEVWNLRPDDAQAKWVYGRNKLYFHLSPYTIDLESGSEEDPLARDMHKSAIYRVSDIDPSVSTRHIVSALSNLVDSNNNRVNYEIVWVNDVIFLVAATIPNCQDPKRFEEQGKIILSALTNRFTKAIVVPFVGFRNELEAAMARRQQQNAERDAEQQELRREQQLHDAAMRAAPTNMPAQRQHRQTAPSANAGGSVLTPRQTRANARQGGSAAVRPPSDANSSPDKSVWNLWGYLDAIGIGGGLKRSAEASDGSNRDSNISNTNPKRQRIG